LEGVVCAFKEFDGIVVCVFDEDPWMFELFTGFWLPDWAFWSDLFDV
jgi:hypothetical protein